MEYHGTTWVGRLGGELGGSRFVLRDACRTIAVDAWDARRKRRSWGITYLDPSPRNPDRLRKAQGGRQP